MASPGESELLASIGRRIRAVRTLHGLTIAELAKRASLDASFVGELERGRRNISVTRLSRLAAALRVDVEELFRDDG